MKNLTKQQLLKNIHLSFRKPKYILVLVVLFLMGYNAFAKNTLRSERCNTMQAIDERLKNNTQFYEKAYSTPSMQRNATIPLTFLHNQESTKSWCIRSLFQ